MSATSEFYQPQLLRYVNAVGVRESDRLRAIRQYTASQSAAHMTIAPELAAYLSWFVKAMGVQHALEVGTFVGYSAAAIAESLPEHGRLVCCDVSEDYAQQAKSNWEKAGLADRITCHVGHAQATLHQFKQQGDLFDFAFIDADKTGYLTYYEQVLALLKPGGVMVFDNVFWSGKVWDEAQQQESTQVIRQLAQRAQLDEAVDSCLLPISDGVLMVRSRG